MTWLLIYICGIILLIIHSVVVIVIVDFSSVEMSY